MSLKILKLLEKKIIFTFYFIRCKWEPIMGAKARRLHGTIGSKKEGSTGEDR